MMKRKIDVPGMIRYKKIGGGSLHITIGGRLRIIKPGELFDARPEEIPELFRDVIIPLDPALNAEADVPAQKKAPSKLQYFVQKREKGVGYYDVVDKNGKPQNEKALRKGEAEELIAELLA